MVSGTPLDRLIFQHSLEHRLLQCYMCHTTFSRQQLFHHYFSDLVSYIPIESTLKQVSFSFWLINYPPPIIYSTILKTPYHSLAVVLLTTCARDKSYLLISLIIGSNSCRTDYKLRYLEAIAGEPFSFVPGTSRHSRVKLKCHR